MSFEVLRDVLIPFIGTSLGAACVFFLKKEMNGIVRRSLSGFAAGVMVAASVWSLIIPAIERSAGMKKLAFVPAAAGLAAGFVVLLISDKYIPILRCDKEECGMKRISKLIIAVTLHNLPEGMAVGAVVAALLANYSGVSSQAALVLSFGIAIQNFPEGAIISMPLCSEGTKKPKAFLYGVLSGAIEPIGALITIIAVSYILPALPYLLAFAAGAMLYVVVDDLVPDMSDVHDHIGTMFFALGFGIMMILDVALG